MLSTGSSAEREGFRSQNGAKKVPSADVEAPVAGLATVLLCFPASWVRRFRPLGCSALPRRLVAALYGEAVCPLAPTRTLDEGTSPNQTKSMEVLGDLGFDF